MIDPDGNDVGPHLDGCPRQPWTQRSPEARARVLNTPITFQRIGGHGHAGTSAHEQWFPGDRPNSKRRSTCSDFDPLDRYDKEGED